MKNTNEMLDAINAAVADYRNDAISDERLMDLIEFAVASRRDVIEAEQIAEARAAFRAVANFSIGG